ncbi:plexin-B-like isoform X2 [Tachypleus tridentatus]|uniref:plexin-B-like isoform X2 n=1 Tax=Tachypleus tridentatus TaxID=6853 RepID=UPI003FD62219
MVKTGDSSRRPSILFRGHECLQVESTLWKQSSMDWIVTREPAWSSLLTLTSYPGGVGYTLWDFRRHGFRRIHQYTTRNVRSIVLYVMCSVYVFVSVIWTVAAREDLNIHSAYTTFNESVNFTHLVVDRDTGRVYVGGTNWLYQFNSSLELELEVRTGPVEDSIQCSPSDCLNKKKVNTVNANKVLVIDRQANKLIVCGSVHQGACRRHELGNISKAEELVPVPVAANDQNSSTYAFIGPAQYFGYLTRVLYVATTNSRLGPYRDMVPAITSRSLEKGNARLFGIIEKSFSTIARVDISSHLRDYYLVNYIYGFHSGGFIYFATVQRKSHLRALEEWGYVTRLTRVCASDAGYNTYTEVTLQCVRKDGLNFNLLQDAIVGPAGSDLAAALHIETGADVFVGVFTSSPDHTTLTSPPSAVCVYSLAEIEQRFTENIHMCYNGSVVTRNMDYIAGSIVDCPEPGEGGNIFNFCMETLKLNGTVPVTATAAATFTNVVLKSVTVTTTFQHTVAFIGTDSGYLKKVLINSGDDVDEFEEVSVDLGNSILADLQLDKSGQFIYVASTYKLAKVRIAKCHQYNSCELCLRARNPYCGWCSLEKQCTVKSACQNATASFGVSSPRWLSLNTQQCIDVQAVKPEQLPITSMATVELVINQLPNLPFGAHYLCVFGNSATVRARVTGAGLACTTPRVEGRPPILPEKDHVTVDLAVRSSETNTDFLHKPFAFYDCSVHKTCSACVTSLWACSWCLQENHCMHNVDSCRRTIITGENNPQNSIMKGRHYCPSFAVNEEILLPNGIRKEIALDGKNLPGSLDDFHCIIEIEGAKQQVLARIYGNKIICAETLYRYKAKVQQLNVTLTVFWHGDIYIDQMIVTLFKCYLLGSHGGQSDCSLCLTRDPKFQCAWCGNQCHYSDLCIKAPALRCPSPRVDWIHPLSGPVEGGTLIAIEGSNLGTNEQEISNKITVGGIPCIVVEYSVSVRVVCRTGPSERPRTAEVMVGNNAGVTVAQEQFLYKEVKLRSVDPVTGPQAGGTRLYLSGENLNVGSQMAIYLDGLPCVVDRTLASNSQVSCRTTRAPTPDYSISALIFIIDNATLLLPNPFTYTVNPTILRIYPLKSFASGGRSVTVVGTSLQAIQQPRMAIFNNETLLNETVCVVISNTQMVCPSPSLSRDAVPSLLTHGKRNTGMHLEELKFRIGFFMDDVTSVRELQANFPTLHSDMVYVPDPRFFSFNGNGIKLYKGESLVIEGEYLRLASTEFEVNVSIGTRPCNLTSLAMTQLVCLPPEDQPQGTDELGRSTTNTLPMVVVRVGLNLRYEVGYLRYEVMKTYKFPPEAIWGIAVGGALLMILSLVILVVLRHKSSLAEQEYKRIQLQMDTLENSVRSECKQAFAELQTDMTDLTNCLQTSGIPTLEHKTFVMKVFFPGIHDHPLLHDRKAKNNEVCSNYEFAMSQFQHLLNTKEFLVTFVNTLEGQKSFNIRDRVNVASLLTVIFMEKMEYATEVLKVLLMQLIERSVNSKHPHLMLRRTESVVEKMLTNWMALNMYNYLKDQAGSTLFLLFCAVKYQIEKGPIDIFTHDAKYSLSEERLLREQIEYSTVTVHIVQTDQMEKLQLQVNDCDTVSQVKSKVLDALYKNIPFSRRPSVHDVDLVLHLSEWKPGNGGRLTLADEDLTTKTTNGWRRINTLRHYGVTESAVMSLVSKHNDSLASYWAGTISFHSISPIISNCDVEQGIRYWHLVKPMADQQFTQKDNFPKAIPEIFLTRLLSTKGTIQTFVDDFLAMALTVTEEIPSAVKWLFDLLDEGASKYGVTDPDVAHSWKSNSLPLRFWVNFVKNPDFILDVYKTPLLDSCLSVVAQTLIDACSTSEHRLGKDSPSNKLLFARDIPAYRKMVMKYYHDISAQPVVTDQEIGATMHALSMSHVGEFDTLTALKDLYVYAVKYNEELLHAVEEDPFCQQTQLNHVLKTLASTLEEETSVC